MNVTWLTCKEDPNDKALGMGRDRVNSSMAVLSLVVNVCSK